MDLVKFSLVAVAAALTFSCSQTATTIKTNTLVSNNANSPGVVAAIPLQPRNVPIGNLDRKARLHAAESVDLVEGDANETYATSCMICHKDNGKGGKVTIKGKNLNAEDLTSDKMKKRSDDELFKYISEGVPEEGMPAFRGNLSEDQIRSVVAHVRGLQSR